MQPCDDSTIFVNEDLSKPENRVNVALFGLMTQDWFRMWFLEKLSLPSDSVVYPPPNSRGSRPDLAVSTPDVSRILALIEVELGTNAGQIEDYRHRYCEPVKSVWGRRRDCGDLSLEEIEEFLGECIDSLQPQVQMNVKHLRKLIRLGLDGHSSSGERTEISAEMRNHPLVAGLIDRLGDSLKFTAGRIGPGELKADTIGESGFSLRTYSPQAKERSVSLLNISGGRQEVAFPTKGWLDKYLPLQHRAAVERYATLLKGKGLDIDDGKVHSRAGTLHVDAVLAMIDELAGCVLAFANHPR